MISICQLTSGQHRLKIKSSQKEILILYEILLCVFCYVSNEHLILDKHVYKCSLISESQLYMILMNRDDLDKINLEMFTECKYYFSSKYSETVMHF